jgi:hypothetical protein
MLRRAEMDENKRKFMKLSTAGGVGLFVTSLAAKVTEKDIDESMKSTPLLSKQRSIFHIIVGNADWEPTGEDLESIHDAFITCLNSTATQTCVITTRDGVVVNEHVLPLPNSTSA